MTIRTVQVHKPRPQAPARVAGVNEPNVSESGRARVGGSGFCSRG